MSQVAIRAALESALDSGVPKIPTAWENQAFKPASPAAAYQQVFVMFATPENKEVGAGYNEIGYMQVTLFYPFGTGSADAVARAALIRALFKKSASFVASGITVSITATPSVGSANPDGDFWALVVKIPFMAQIYT